MTNAVDRVRETTDEDASFRLWALLAFFGFGIMVTTDRSQAVVGLLIAVVGLLLLILRQAPPRTWMSRAIAAGIPLLFGALWLTSPVTPYGTEPAWLRWVAGAFWVLFATTLLTRPDRMSRRMTTTIVVTGLIASAVFGSILVMSSRTFGIDVTFLHVSATDALLSGSNPYGEAVTVFDGAPERPSGSQIVGYLYPPGTLFPFAMGTMADDPRVTSLVSWLALLTTLGMGAVRSATPLVPLAAFTGMAALPGWPLVLVSSWTEPLTMAIFAVALVAWRKPWVSAAVLGYALATKQYLVVIAPLLAFWRVDQRARRLVIAGAVALATFTPILIWGDLGAAYSSLIEFHLGTAPRSDGTSLAGMSALLGFPVNPPLLITLAVPLIVAALASRAVRRAREFAIAIGLVLAVTFFLGSQAFANYWFLPAGLMALAASLQYPTSVGSDCAT